MRWAGGKGRLAAVPVGRSRSGEMMRWPDRRAAKRNHVALLSKMPCSSTKGGLSSLPPLSIYAHFDLVGEGEAAFSKPRGRGARKKKKWAAWDNKEADLSGEIQLEATSSLDQI